METRGNTLPAVVGGLTLLVSVANAQWPITPTTDQSEGRPPQVRKIEGREQGHETKEERKSPREVRMTVPTRVAVPGEADRYQGNKPGVTSPPFVPRREARVEPTEPPIRQSERPIEVGSPGRGREDRSVRPREEEQVNEHRGIEKKDIRREETPRSAPTWTINTRTVNQDSSGESESEIRSRQLREKLEQLRSKQSEERRSKTEKPADAVGAPIAGRPDIGQSPVATPTPTQRLSREELRQRLEQRRKEQERQGRTDTPTRGQVPTPTPVPSAENQPGVTSPETKATPESQDKQKQRLTKEQLRQRLEELRRQKSGQQEVKPTPAASPTPTDQSSEKSRDIRARLEELRRQKGRRPEEPRATSTPGAPQPTPPSSDQGASQRQRLEQLRQQRAQQLEQKRQEYEEKRRLIEEKRKQLSEQEREKLRRLAEEAKGRDLSQVVQKLKQEEKEKGRLSREEFQAKIAELRRMKAEERNQLIGANIAAKKLTMEESLARNKATLEQLRQRYGDVQARPRVELAREDLERLNRGEAPLSLRPYGDLGVVRRPLEREWRLRHESWFCPPPPPRPHYGVDFVGFSWEYWDGRYRYDHQWAINIFVSLGHSRYDGYDGVIVGGRYFCYGWGWIDGCIDYGECRVWVPGFWAPYTVTECGECEVWVPPVYDWVWTGCCWEQVLVSGGYFVRQPTGCYTVTRWRWIPGHFEYYRC